MSYGALHRILKGAAQVESARPSLLGIAKIQQPIVQSSHPTLTFHNLCAARLAATAAATSRRATLSAAEISRILPLEARLLQVRSAKSQAVLHNPHGLAQCFWHQNCRRWTATGSGFRRHERAATEQVHSCSNKDLASAVGFVWMIFPACTTVIIRQLLGHHCLVPAGFESHHHGRPKRRQKRDERDFGLAWYA